MLSFLGNYCAELWQCVQAFTMMPLRMFFPHIGALSALFQAMGCCSESLSALKLQPFGQQPRAVPSLMQSYHPVEGVIALGAQRATRPNAFQRRVPIFNVSTKYLFQKPRQTDVSTQLQSRSRHSINSTHCRSHGLIAWPAAMQPLQPETSCASKAWLCCLSSHSHQAEQMCFLGCASCSECT